LRQDEIEEWKPGKFAIEGDVVKLKLRELSAVGLEL
jgi:hypothetical protein